jgi:hypothetical protein
MRLRAIDPVQSRASLAMRNPFVSSTVTQLDGADTQANAMWSTLQAASTRVSTTLSPSVLCDLLRFEDEACGADLLPVLAAIVRHMRPLLVYLQLLDRMVELSVFPREQQFRCDLDLCNLSSEDATRLQVMHVAPIPAAGSRDPAVARAAHGGPVAPLLWQMALRGNRAALLPEIAGPVRYRLAPGLPFRGLPMDPWCASMLRRLSGEPTTIDDLAEVTDWGRARTQRLLNAVYLQGRLMITRSLPPQRLASQTRRLTH